MEIRVLVTTASGRSLLHTTLVQEVANQVLKDLLVLQALCGKALGVGLQSTTRTTRSRTQVLLTERRTTLVLRRLQHLHLSRVMRVLLVLQVSRQIYLSRKTYLSERPILELTEFQYGFGYLLLETFSSL